jgi:hypothetical protein
LAPVTAETLIGRCRARLVVAVHEVGDACVLGREGVEAGLRRQDVKC